MQLRASLSILSCLREAEVEYFLKYLQALSFATTVVPRIKSNSYGGRSGGNKKIAKLLFSQKKQ